MQTLRRELAPRKTVAGSGKHIKQKVMSTSDAAIKTAGRRIKTPQRSVKNAGQTVRTTAKTTQKTVQAAKAVATGVKAAVKATIAAVKAIIAATKALIAAIAAGGWVAVVVIIVICLIALIVGSCFGIFFSNENSGSGQTMQTVVQEINTDYQTQLDTTKANISYDVLEMSGSRAVWPVPQRRIFPMMCWKCPAHALSGRRCWPFMRSRPPPTPTMRRRSPRWTIPKRRF